MLCNQKVLLIVINQDKPLIHCILVDSSSVKCWKSPFVGSLTFHQKTKDRKLTSSKSHNIKTTKQKTVKISNTALYQKIEMPYNNYNKISNNNISGATNNHIYQYSL